MPGSDPIVLGIDPGSHITGFGVVSQSGSRLIHIESGSIHAPKQAPLETRLRHIHDRLLTVIRNTSPMMMAVEKVFYAKNARSAIALAHARGVALLAAAQTGLAVAEYSPMEVKMATVGYGRATKDQVVEMMHRLFRIPAGAAPDAYDRTDALAVALCHLNTHKTNLRISKAEISSRAEGIS